MLCALASGAFAGDWEFSASIRGGATLTDNVSLAPQGQEDWDLVWEVTPSITVRREGARARMQASYTPSLYVYTRNSEDSTLWHRLSALGTVEAVENLFYVDAIAIVTQSYLSPFGPRPLDALNLNDNRAQTAMLGLSPYVQSVTPGGYRYLLRNDTTWTAVEGSQVPDQFESRVLAKLDSPIVRVGWGVDYDYRYTKFDSQQSYYEQLARVRGIWRANSDLTLSARLGYETNDYTIEAYSGEIYGAGAEWTPTPRTRLSGYVEHRFFGTSYEVNFNHRTRATGWRLRAARLTQTYRDQLFTLGPGELAVVTDAALQNRIADPLERQRAVEDFLLRSGLPSTLLTSQTFYTNQVYVAEQIDGTVTVFGGRNRLWLTLFWDDNEPVTTDAPTLAVALGTAGPFKQHGGIVGFTRDLGPRTAITFSAQRTDSTGTRTGTAPADAKSTEDTLRVIMHHQLTPKTSAAIGVRWVDFDSDFRSDYRERAAFGGVRHDF
jgi:uncharacterized protein (PEP-CTERM system associated)